MRSLLFFLNIGLNLAALLGKSVVHSSEYICKLKSASEETA